jgi:hypothetical protein
VILPLVQKIDESTERFFAAANASETAAHDEQVKSDKYQAAVDKESSTAGKFQKVSQEVEEVVVKIKDEETNIAAASAELETQTSLQTTALNQLPTAVPNSAAGSTQLFANSSVSQVLRWQQRCSSPRL